MFEHRTGLIPPVQSPQYKRCPVISAPQIGIDFQGAFITFCGLFEIAELQLTLANVVGRVRIFRITLNHRLKMRPRRLGFPEIKSQKSADEMSAQVARILCQDRAGNVEGKLLVAFLLTIQRCDCEIGLCVQPVRLRLDDGGECFLRANVIVMPHQRDAAIVKRNNFGCQLRSLPGTGGESE